MKITQPVTSLCIITFQKSFIDLENTQNITLKYLFIYLFSFAYNYTNNNMHTTISVQPQSANVEKLVSSFVA